MIVFKILIFLLAMFSGTIFSLFILTFIESRSRGFQAFIGKVHGLLPKGVWTFLLLLSIVAFGFLFYYSVADYARAGIFAGLMVGIFVCFRAGPNIDYKDMEKAGDEFVKEQQDKRNRRANGGRKRYVGAAPKSATGSAVKSKGSSGKAVKANTSKSKSSGNSKASNKGGSSDALPSSDTKKSAKPRRLN